MYRPPRNTPLLLPPRAPNDQTRNGSRQLEVPPSGKCKTENIMEIDSTSDCEIPTIPHKIETPSKSPSPTNHHPEPHLASPLAKSKLDSWLIQNVRKITSKTYPANKAPLFKLENTLEAATINTAILKSYDWNFEKAIDAQQNSILQVGSEYRPLEDLEDIFSHHKDWKKFETLLTKGVEYSFDKDKVYTEEMRKSDLANEMKKGNSKNTHGLEEVIMANYTKEIVRGWMIPFLKTSLMKVVGVGVVPIGIASQWTMDKDNNRVIKNRTTHNLSNKMKSGHSWNGMLDEDLMEPCLFGWCLVRILHRIHDIRQRKPKSRIFISKIDLDAAFRRLHVCTDHALLSTTIIEQIAYFLGRLSFGGSDGPGKHDIPSNMCVELAQKIVDDPTWDPKELYSPRAAQIPADKRLPDDIPFGKAHPLKVKIEDEKDCYIDSFIDDLISIILDELGLPERGRNAVALALHTFFRPTNPDDPVPRDDILSLRKLLAEGGLEETKMVLGWFIDTRRFIIKLARDKAARWILDIDDIIAKISAKEPVSTKEIESLIGKLNTASYIHSEGRFFMSRIRYSLKVSKINKGKAKLPRKVHLDLLLWKKFLAKLSERGRSINHITYTLPLWFTKQDASEFALGGFNCTGLSWQYIIPKAWVKLIHINVLEFLAVLITTWMSILQLGFVDEDGIKFLAQTDNTSALGWLKGSTRYDKNNKLSTVLREKIGRKFAELLSDAGISHYSQHVAGVNNEIADHLSRNVEMSHSQQISSILSKFPKFCPDNLRIVELPEEILSWILSFWQESTQIMVLPKAQKTRLLAAAESGTNSQPKGTLTLSSEISQNQKSLRSLVLSRTSSDVTTLAKKIRMNFEDHRFVPNSTQYLRRSDQWDSMIPSEISEEKCTHSSDEL